MVGMTVLQGLLTMAAVVLVAGCASQAKVLIGTHVPGAGKGIRLAQLDLDKGSLSVPALAAQSDDAAYLALTRDGRHLYVTNSVRNFGGVPHMGGLSAFAVDPHAGTLALLNSVPSGGENPPYISLDRSEHFVLVANYNGNAVSGEGGTIAIFALKMDGSIGERTAFEQLRGTGGDPVRQNQAYAHSILTDPSNRFVLAADLGTDKVMIYRFDAATGKITPNVPPFATVKPGNGPRHMTFHPNGKMMYLAEEMASAVAVFTWDDQKGLLRQLQELPMLPSDFKGTSTAAEIRLHPTGKWLYASNRGHDSIVQYALDADGKLTLVGWVPSGGKVPRNFEISPDGRWMVVCHQGDDTVVVFAISAEDGKLKQNGSALKVESPFGIRFLPE